MTSPPRYLCWLDRDSFLRELSYYATDTISRQLGRDIAHLAEDLHRRDEVRERELRDLHRECQELEDASFKTL